MAYLIAAFYGGEVKVLEPVGPVGPVGPGVWRVLRASGVEIASTRVVLRGERFVFEVGGSGGSGEVMPAPRPG